MKKAIRQILAWYFNLKKARKWIGTEPVVIVNGKKQPEGHWRVIDENDEKRAAILLSQAGLPIIEIANKLSCPPSIIAEYLAR